MLARTELAIALESIDLRSARVKKLPHAALSKASLKFLKRICNRPVSGKGFPLSSNDVRMAMAIAMIEETYLFADENEELRNGRERLRLLTCSPNVGICKLEEDHFPVTLTKLAIERLVRRAPVSGLVMIDFGLFNPEALSPEDMLVIHAHGILSIAPDCRLKVKKLQRLMSPANCYNSLGAPVTSLKARGSGRDATLQDGDVLGLGRYLTKVTCGTNTLYNSKRGQKSRSNHRDWTAIGALRQLEIESYVDAPHACYSIGEMGSELRIRWRRRFFELLDYCEQPRGFRIEVQERHEGWQRLWAEIDNGFVAADPDAVITTTSVK